MTSELKPPASPHVQAAPLERSAKSVEASTEAMKASTDRMADVADRRTQLAADRTILAAERTYAAWVRTGLASLASGVGARAALRGVIPDPGVLAAATLLILFSAFCFAAAVWRELAPGAPPPRPDTPRLSPVLLLVVNGLLIVVSLFAVVGVWTGALAAR